MNFPAGRSGSGPEVRSRGGKSTWCTDPERGRAGAEGLVPGRGLCEGVWVQNGIGSSSGAESRVSVRWCEAFCHQNGGSGSGVGERECMCVKC